MQPVDFDLEEYRALRAEIIQSMDDGNQVMSFGLASLVAVVGGALLLSERDMEALGFFIFVALLPFLAALVLSYWFAAQERIAKASHYLSGVEERIKRACGAEHSVSWEAWLRMPKSADTSSKLWTAELSGIILFLIFIFASLFFGLGARGTNLDIVPKLFIAIPSMLLNGVLVVHVIARYLHWRQWLGTSYDDAMWSTYEKARTDSSRAN